MQSTYDISRSYQENYREGPFFFHDIPERLIYPQYSFFHKKLTSKIGVPAGPLLNEKYTTLYAHLGFDIITYKTVRSKYLPSHPIPNCVYLPSRILTSEDVGKEAHPINDEPNNVSDLTITNSFGIPSQEPQEWQEDMEKAVQAIGSDQFFIGSVVGTADNEEDWIRDCVHTACMVKEIGVDAVELDISCPNVGKNRAGSVYLDPYFSSEISKACKKALGDTPLFIKVSYFSDDNTLEQVISRNAPYVDGIVAINTIRMKIVDTSGIQVLPGEGREYGGVCGKAIQGLAKKTVADIITIKNKNHYDFLVIGCGGVVEYQDFDEFFGFGCDAVLSATGAMWDPFLAYNYKKYGAC